MDEFRVNDEIIRIVGNWVLQIRLVSKLTLTTALVK